MFFQWKYLLFLLLTIHLTPIFCEEPAKQPETGKVSDEDDDDDEEQSKPREKIHFTPPKVGDNVHFALFFNSPSDLASDMTVSLAKKDGVDSAIAKYDGQWAVEVAESSAIQGDYSLVLQSKAKHHAVAARFRRPFTFQPGKQFVMQYDVKFQNGMECGGAYVKLLTATPDMDLTNFHDKTPYTIMFGPDKCGLDYKMHFIFRHKHPKTGAFEEKHAKKPKTDLENFFSDKKTHLYTLVINPDNTFQIYVDQKLINSGSLLEDMEPTVNPAKEIDDPADAKPTDWDERAKVPDSTAKKPDDWDESASEFVPDEKAKKPEGWLDTEPTMISDPTAVKPKDWDAEMDGEWEPPKIENPKCKDAPGCGEWKRPKVKNPAYKGKWTAPMIDNPAYKGVWKPKRVANPNYFEDKEPHLMTPIGAIGLELWSMTAGIAFDNFLVADSKKAADDFAAATWELKKDEERRADPNAQSVVDAIREATNEKPWLWAVIILVVALPVVLIIAYCCMRGGGGADEPALRKKTDAPSPDDEPIPEEAVEDDGEAEHESGGEDHVRAGGDQSSPGKGSLEEDEEDEEEEEEGESPAEEEAEPEPPKVEENHSEEEEKTRSSPRNRKARARKH